MGFVQVEVTHAHSHMHTYRHVVFQETIFLCAWCIYSSHHSPEPWHVWRANTICLRKQIMRIICHFVWIQRGGSALVTFYVPPLPHQHIFIFVLIRLSSSADKHTYVSWRKSELTEDPSRSKCISIKLWGSGCEKPQPKWKKFGTDTSRVAKSEVIASR